NDTLSCIVKWTANSGFYRYTIETLVEVNDFEAAWGKLFAVGKSLTVRGIVVDYGYIYNVLMLDGQFTPVSIDINNNDLYNGSQKVDVKSITFIDGLLYISGSFYCTAMVAWDNF